MSTILSKYGERALCIEELYVKLFMLHFQDAQYQEALQDALVRVAFFVVLALGDGGQACEPECGLTERSCLLLGGWV